MIQGGVPLLQDRPIAQIGVLVPDLDRALQAHARVGERDRWLVVEPAAGPRRGTHTYRGAPMTASTRLAFSPSTPEIELVQHVAGDSIYSEWLAAHGFGLHHMAVDVEDLRTVIDSMTSAGFELLQVGLGYGPNGSGGHGYFDTEDALGYILEAIEPVAP